MMIKHDRTVMVFDHGVSAHDGEFNLITTKGTSMNKTVMHL
jgi:hypothetical protein